MDLSQIGSVCECPHPLEWHDLEARLATLTAALEKYGYHDDECAYMTCTWGPDRERAACSCGWQAALAAARGT